MPAPLYPETALGRLIRSSREAIQMTQDELAEKIKATQQTVSRWEAGKIMPPIERFPALANVLQVETQALYAAAEQQSQARPHAEPEPSRLEALEREVDDIKSSVDEILTLLRGDKAPARQRRLAPVRAARKTR